MKENVLRVIKVGNIKHHLYVMYMNTKYVLNKVAKRKKEDMIPRTKGTGEWR